MTFFGVLVVFLLKMCRMITASVSTLKIIRHVLSTSLIRNSKHRCPIAGMGRACGMASISPRCNFRSKKPASIRAACENGGDFTSQCNQTNGLSSMFMAIMYVRFDLVARLFFSVAGTIGARYKQPKAEKFEMHSINNIKNIQVDKNDCRAVV